MLERHLGGDDAEPVPSGPDSFVVEGKALGVDDEALASGVDAAATPGSLNLSQFCDVSSRAALRGAAAAGCKSITSDSTWRSGGAGV